MRSLRWRDAKTRPRRGHAGTPPRNSTPRPRVVGEQQVAVEVDVVAEARDLRCRRRSRARTRPCSRASRSSPRARAACAIRTASRMPPDLASLIVTPCARSAQAATSPSVMAVLVDVDRDGRAALQLGTVRVARRQRLLAVFERHLRAGSSSASVERPVLVDVDLKRQIGRGAHRLHALEVEPVAPAELQLQPPEAARSRPPRPGGPCRRGRRARPSTRSAARRAAARAACRPARRRAFPAGRGAPRRAQRAPPARRPAARLRSRRAPRDRRRARPSPARRAPKRPTRRSARSAPPRRTPRGRRARTSTSTSSTSSCVAREITKRLRERQRDDPGAQSPPGLD